VNILSTIDIQGNLHVYKKLAPRAKQAYVNIIVLAGDLTGISTGRTEEETIKQILNSIGKPVLL